MRDHLKGFSILELLVVVAIVAIMAGVAYPNFMKWYMKKELHADALKLFDYIHSLDNAKLALKISRYEKKLNKLKYTRSKTAVI